MTSKILFFFCLTITCCQFSYAQDGPFKFDGKTDIFIGNVGHWKAVQDVQANLILTSWSARYFMINNTSFLQNGNVGIGTTNPVAKLNVNGGGIRLTNSAGHPLGINIDMKLNETWAREYSISYDSLSKMLALGVYANAGTMNYAYIGGNTTTATAHSAPWMVFRPDGNVGIGTTTPGTYKLAVAGTIAARKVKVTQETWPDYVFDPAYKLPSLQYVEQFIKDNKHLPDVPSAKEVTAEGLDLGDMNKRLLQKVEELTLYLIRLDKENELLKSEVENLKKSIK